MSEERVKEILEGNTSSVGINNVRKRIQIIYGDVDDIKIQAHPARGTKVTIYLPLAN
jgi:two-component system, sensor histidine kinase YesM